MRIDLGRFRLLIRDRATVFVSGFDEIFITEGIDVLRGPTGAPRANSIAERFVRSARNEMLNHTLIWNERQLHALMVEFLAHYNGHRPHRSVQRRSPDTVDEPLPEPVPIDEIRRTRVLDGLINQYHHAA